MHVALVGPDLEENLSLRYLSASLRAAGHRTTIVRFERAGDSDSVRDAVKGAALVGLSMCYQIRAREFLDLAAAIKRDEPSRRVVAGGHYASCEARALLEHHRAIDVIAIHEAERTIVELADLPELSPEALGRIRGIVFRQPDGIVATPPREILADLDELPWPDRTGKARLVVGVPTAYMMGSRGCQSACDYCCITTLHRLVPGKRFRQRRPEAIAEEMAWSYHERGVRQFVFHDDNFLVSSVARNMERLEALDEALRGRGVGQLGLVLKCRPADLHPEVLLRLREMGLLRIFLGIESATESGLRSLGRRQTVEQAHAALRLCEELGISTQYTLITFHPEATAASIKADLGFAREHLAHPLSFCRAEAYSGTPLEQRLIDSGRADGDYLFRGYGFTDPATEAIWHHARTALRERLWSCNHLLGRVVQLDHLAATFRHFYSGAAVDELVASFLEWQLEVNRDSVDLFQELVEVCERHAPGSIELAAAVADIASREEASREAFEARRQVLRRALYKQSFGMLGLSRPAPGLLRRLPVRSLVPHAAAVLVAVGLLGCSGRASEHDSGTDAFHDADGVYEAPPWDSSFPDADADADADATDADADATDADADADAVDSDSSDAFDEPDGVFEAPPWDSGI